MILYSTRELVVGKCVTGPMVFDSQGNLYENLPMFVVREANQDEWFQCLVEYSSPEEAEDGARKLEALKQDCQIRFYEVRMD